MRAGSCLPTRRGTSSASLQGAAPDRRPHSAPATGRGQLARAGDVPNTGPAGSDCDDDLSLGVALFLVPDGRRDLFEGITAVDSRRDLAVLDELRQGHKVLLLLRAPD